MLDNAHFADEKSQWELCDNVGNIGDGEDDRVLPVGQFEVRHQSSSFCVTDVGTLRVSIELKHRTPTSKNERK